MKNIFTALLFAGFSLTAHAEKVTVAINGMHCGDCAASIQEKFKAMPEVKDVNVSFKNKNMVLHTAGKQDLTDEKIKTEIATAGYKTGKITRAE
ncbi:MAG: heavy-metal-associated domain-containing protein [Bacteriovoracia bacterium]